MIIFFDNKEFVAGVGCRADAMVVFFIAERLLVARNFF
jgi:hypothetical protein